ncbi:MAG: HAD-IB family hydrolase [Actinomycetota bacterium]
MPKPRPAAIFDLDRTLIAGSSSRTLQRHFAEAGLTDHASNPISEVFYKAFDIAGESAILQQMARFGPRAAKGWSLAAVDRAATAAATDLEEQVLPFARRTIEEHRAAGRLLVLATATPRAWIAPFAARLGFDHLVATEWTDDGKVFTGALDGPMIWRRDKAKAVKALAASEDIDLGRSYAYSDSYFDGAMLDSVGTAVAVNPDVRLAALATLRRWEIRHFDKPPGVVKIAGLELQEILRPFARPELVPNARIELSGLDNIPSHGGAIVVGNHRSYFDPTVMSLVIARAGRNARYLGKKEVFDVPLIGDLAIAAGGIRVDRGTGSSEPLDAAIEALKGGELVTLMPQGTIPRGPAFFDPELKGRWGAARMATAARVPVIPVGLWGTERVWPRSSRMPHMRIDDPPTVTAHVGPPVELKYRSEDADTKRIMAAISDLLPPESRTPHEPTAQELARTYPPGYEGDPGAETDRRPGSDT